MEKVLVTGGAGFIGSHLVKLLLENNYHVIVLDTLLRGNKIDKDVLSNVELFTDDIRNEDAVSKRSIGCRFIFHLAALIGVDIVADAPVETMEIEVLGMKNVSNAALKNGVEKIIYASTSGVYGHSAIEKSVVESVQLDPRTSYSIAKRYNEIYLSALSEQKSIQSISLRFFNVYGQKQDNRMVIPRFFEQAMKTEPITIYGNGKQTRDFTYVYDTVLASLKLAETVRGFEIFNIANQNEISIFELAEKIKSAANSKSEILFLDAPKKRYDFEVERRIGNSDKLHKAIGIRPETDLEAGLNEIYTYFQQKNV